ncbi:hypothetical protein V6N11_074691 [Hibiscus sabdariffa]|uniref:Uncharacterized protein n=1 Tax=Hibiscus sabdariffa TaxID=183260 RepID=A0ABR2R493_9ROSI
MGRQEKKQSSTVLMPSNRKIKMDDAEMGDWVIERKNKRKPMDSERQSSVLENEEPRICLSSISMFSKSWHRQYVRQGFALGLAALVAKIPSIKVDSLLKLIVNLLDVSSSMKGQDVRDCLLGLLFAYGALARSDRLTKEWLVDKDTLLIKDFKSAVISLVRRKQYLQEPAVSIILERGWLQWLLSRCFNTSYMLQLPSEALLDHILEAPGITQWFQEAVDVGSPDALLLALKIHEKLPIDSTSFGNLLPNPFNSSKLFSADYLSSIDNCVKTYFPPKIPGCIKLRFLKELLDWVQNDDVRRVAIIVAFQKHSNGKFDCITKTKTMKDSEISSIEEYDSIGLRNSEQKEILKFLAVQGLFFASLGNEVTSFELEEKFRWPKATNSSALCKMCIEKLQSMLANVQKVSEPRSLAIGLPNDLGWYFTRLFSGLRNIPSVLPFRTLNDEDEQAVKKLLEIESILYKKNVSASCRDIGSNGEDDLDRDPAPESTDVLVDTLVSLPPQSSAPIRSAIEQADEELTEASDDSDGGMDDEAMFRMDAYIAEIFKHKAGGETAQPQLVLLKLRVLSLLEIYLHENREGSEQLGQRIWRILQRKILKEKKLPADGSMQLSVLESLLEKNLRKRSGLTLGFLKEILRRHPRFGQRLLGSLLRKCSSAKSDYRRLESLDLVIGVLKS